MNCSSSRSGTNVSCLRSSRRKMLLSLSTTPRAESGSNRISAETVFRVLNRKCGLIWLESASIRAFSNSCWCRSRFISTRVLFQIFSGAATDIRVAITTSTSHQSNLSSVANSHLGLVASTSATRPSSRPTHAPNGAISHDNSAFRNRRIVALGMLRNVNGPKFQRSSLLGIACRIKPPSSPAVDAAGLLGGLIRQAIPNKEDLWNFGPFTFLNIPKATMRLLRKAELSWEMAPLGACVGLELGRVALVLATKPKWLFATDDKLDWWLVLVVIATLMSVAAPLKIWNNTRVEMNLERHQQLLLKARMDALSSQINPHFLFNTLNTVSALIRFDPDSARGVVLRLSNILRRLLRRHETFVPLREELQFIDDYLDIEVARFGKDNLDIVKQIEESALEAFIPSMLLQPIVENSLKHGLAPKLGGGKIQLRAVQREGRLQIEIEDNGVGISEEKMPHVYVEGIGLSNVRERLRVLYGTDFHLDMQSRPGEGTVIRIEVPELTPALEEAATG